MKKTIMLSAVASVLLGLAVRPASAAAVCDGFLPPNDLSIPVGSMQALGIGQDQFNAVLDTVQKLYAPEVAARGAVLEIRRLWTDATVNASAQQQGKTYILNMYGGLARHAAITMDGFALVACHEMGHHLGGAPRKGTSWASNEGQADYYANLKCLRRVFADTASSAFTRSVSGDAFAEKSCAQTFPDPKESALCMRNALAGKSVSVLFQALHNDAKEPAFDTPDPKVVTTMFNDHPATQCRMDTYLQGSLCTQPVSSVLSNTNPVTGTCTRSGGFSVGMRPLCWYKPAMPAELLPSFAGTAVLDLPAAQSVPGPVFSLLRSAYPW